MPGYIKRASIIASTFVAHATILSMQRVHAVTRFFSVVGLTQIPSRQYHRTARYKWDTKQKRLTHTIDAARIINSALSCYFTQGLPRLSS